MSQSYSMYHCHDYYSNPIAGVDSVVSPQRYVDAAKELGFKNFGFANHGNLYNWIEHKDLIEAEGMKYIHACELYLTFDSGEEDEEGELLRHRDNYHMVAIAKNWEGVKELNRLVSNAFNRSDGVHFYFMPRVTYDELCGVSDNLMFTTACVASPLGVKSSDESREKCIEFLAQHKDNCYLEIQHHPCDKQAEYNRYIYNLSVELGIPLIAGTDTHSLDDTSEAARQLLQKAMNVRYDDENEFNLKLLSYEELCAAYRQQNSLSEAVWLEAIENTNRMADRIETFSLDFVFKYPRITENGEEKLWKKIEEGFRSHPIASKRYSWDEVKERCREEYEVMRDTGAVDFMLLQAYLREWEVANGVHTGFGRGSVGGSFVAYLLRITDIDSIKNKLSFSRFMSRERISLADIDTDYDDDSRKKTREFMMTRHLDLPGMDSSEIVTFGTMNTRKAIEYMGKAFDLSLDTVRDIKNSLGQNDEVTPELRAKYPELFEYVDIVKGVVINTSSHASGHLVTDRVIAEELGLCSNKDDPYPICCQEMSVLDKYNWVKFDLLGLRTLKHINLCSEYAGLPYLTPDSTVIADMRDPAVYAELQKDTSMIFQYESDMAYAFVRRFFAKDVLEKVKEKLGSVDLARMGAIATAALRPAGSSYRNEIAYGDFVSYDVKQIQDFLNPTFGRLVFQETITGFLVEFCGYSSGEADVVRRLVAKKHPEDLEKVLPEITEGFCRVMGEKYGMDEATAHSVIEPFLQTIIDASSYAFNEAHSISYHGISYISAWERLYYPVEWACAGLNAYNGFDRQTTSITNWCKRNGINVKPIRFGESRSGYSFNKETREIFKGVDSVKFMNPTVAEELFALSKEHFNTFTELLYAIGQRTTCNSRQVDALIRLGYFSDFGEINVLLSLYEVFLGYYKSDHSYKRFRNFKIETLESRGIADLARTFAENATEKTLQKVDVQRLLEHMEVNFTKFCKRRELQRVIEDQMELLGYIDIQDPKYSGIVYIEEVTNTKFSPRVRVLGLKSGVIMECKVRQAIYKKNPIHKGDVLRVTAGQWQNKKVCVDPEMRIFKDDPGVREYWLTKYHKVEI